MLPLLPLIFYLLSFCFFLIDVVKISQVFELCKYFSKECQFFMISVIFSFQNTVCCCYVAAPSALRTSRNTLGWSSWMSGCGTNNVISYILIYCFWFQYKHCAVVLLFSAMQMLVSSTSPIWPFRSELRSHLCPLWRVSGIGCVLSFLLV